MRQLGLFVTAGALAGGLLVLLGIPFLVFVIDPVGLTLQTGIQLLDSWLYTLGGVASIVLVSIYWSVFGGAAGAAAGLLLGLARQMRSTTPSVD